MCQDCNAITLSLCTMLAGYWKSSPLTTRLSVEASCSEHYRLHSLRRAYFLHLAQIRYKLIHPNTVCGDWSYASRSSCVSPEADIANQRNFVDTQPDKFYPSNTRLSSGSSFLLDNQDHQDLYVHTLLLVSFSISHTHCNLDNPHEY